MNPYVPLPVFENLLHLSSPGRLDTRQLHAIALYGDYAEHAIAHALNPNASRAVD